MKSLSPDFISIETEGYINLVITENMVKPSKRKKGMLGWQTLSDNIGGKDNASI